MIVARMKNARGTSAYWRAPCTMKKGVPSKTALARNPRTSLRRNDKAEYSRSTRPKVKNNPITMGTAGVSTPAACHPLTTVSGSIIG